MKFVCCLIFFLFRGVGFAQPNSCVTSAVSPIVRAEGLTERIGDIVYNCSGLPNTTVNSNFSISLNTNVSNRLSTNNTLTGLVFTIDTGSGPQPVLATPSLATRNTVAYNGVLLTFSPQGTFVLRVSGIRANATGIPVNTQIFASLGGNLPVTSSLLPVAVAETGLFVSYADTLVCAQYGSPLPATIDFSDLILAQSSFSSIRLTEGFADAFGPKSAPANLNADTGERIVVRYGAFPAGARLFVPDVIAGSDAVQQTAGGDFEVAAAGGMYAPSANGSLLLARVAGANANGGGGTPVFTPGALGSGTVTFNTVSELQIVNGSAYVVYEVVDANPTAEETAQFPTFLGLGVDGNRQPTQTTSQVFFAPQSTIVDASSSEPIPRFAAATLPTDCSIIGDCSTYLPQLTISTASFQFTGTVGGATQQSYFTIANRGGGKIPWVATITYASGSAWLALDPYSGPDGANVRIYAAPGNLNPGVYTATITVNAQIGGTAQIPVTFTVNAAAVPPKPSPAILSVLNSATLNPVPAVAGSLTTIMGSGFTGKIVSVTFDGLSATILFINDTQINLLVPADLGSKSSTQLVVTVDGVSTAPRTVALAPFEPGIFKGAILNQDGTVNDSSHGAPVGSIIALWATGLSGTGTITGNIAGRDLTPLYGGPAPELPGVQQINLRIPADLTVAPTEVYVCGIAADGSKTCSIPAQLTLQ